MKQRSSVDKNVEVERHEEPGVNVAVKVSSEQNIKGGMDAQAVGGDADQEDVNATGKKSKDKKKKKKEKKKKHSSSSSDGEESDDDNDRAKSKKKATAGVTTRINIFTGAQGTPAVGMQAGITGQPVVPVMNTAMPMIQQMPMLPMIEQVAVKKEGKKRSTKKAMSKSSSGEYGQSTAVIPPGAAGLVAGPDGQDVLVIPMPPGVKLPPFGNLNDMFAQSTETQLKKKKKSSEQSANIGVAGGTSKRASIEGHGAQMGGQFMAEEFAITKTTMATRGGAAGAEATGEQRDAGQANEQGAGRVNEQAAVGTSGKCAWKVIDTGTGRVTEQGVWRTKEEGAVRAKEEGAGRVNEQAAGGTSGKCAWKVIDTGTGRVTEQGVWRMNEEGAVRAKEEGAERVNEQGTGQAKGQGSRRGNEPGAGLGNEHGEVEPPPSGHKALEMSPRSPEGEDKDDKSLVTSDDDSNLMMMVIFAAVVGIIIIVVVVFIVLSSGASKSETSPAASVSSDGASAKPIHEGSGHNRHRAVRRHPIPEGKYMRLLRRFKHPVEAYWNIQ